MSPDLNSLPASRSPLQLPSSASPDVFRRRQASPAGTQSPRHRASPHIERRRSSVQGDWSLNDGAGTIPINPGNPQHHRAPSLGELHQELENEQEAQVNRLLGLIRRQQAQIDQYQSALSSDDTQGAPQLASSQSTTTTTHTQPHQPHSHGQVPSRPSSTAPPPLTHSSRASFSLSRQSSHRSSRTGSPMLRPSQYTAHNSPGSTVHSTSLGNSTSHGSGEVPEYGGALHHRDEMSLIQAETAMVQRENQMLKVRVRELERQLQSLSVDSNDAAPSATADVEATTAKGGED